MADKRAANGGARPNAGRKPKTEIHASAIQMAERRCADRLPQTLENLEEIADGRAEQTKEVWAAAATVTVGKGAYVKPAFPDLPPDQLVLVSQETITFAPDTRANMYLADRVMGRPSDGDEMKIQEIVQNELSYIFEKLRQVLPAGVLENAIAAVAANGSVGVVSADDAASTQAG